eukprot:6709480-Ditylum_brightwellii.AAC.3
MKQMDEQVILKHWILPEKGLNKGMCCKNQVPGNMSELNALNSNINRDIYCAVLDHVSYTASPSPTGKHEFSASIPKCQDSAYLRLWDTELQRTHGWDAGVLSSRRILEDMTRIVDYSILKQFSVRGVLVQGCGTCRDRRNDMEQAVENRGGLFQAEPRG